ncbi:MAG: adventurous gliding motility protein R [Bdellovibrio sp.]|nr:MAG: adventurous gliding motility protein R [Bdellovibrio sp.]
MFEFLNQARVVVCVGTGGVGKTTVAAALAYRAARRGRRVLVLTVDPSQRLKTTLGLATTGDWITVDASELKGRLCASVMDVQKTFDSFVLKAAETQPEARKILDNRLYKQLTTTLGGSQEFSSIENLYAAVGSGEFDLVILDTPPAQHVMDFLNAPQKLASVFTEGIARWFRDPKAHGENFWVSVFQSGTRQVLRVLERLTGSEFMRELSQFFQQIHTWQAQLENRAVESHRILVHPETHFLMVAGFDEAKFIEAEKFSREIKKNGYQLSGLIINRAKPLWAQMPSSQDPYCARFLDYYRRRSERTHEFEVRTKQLFEIIELPELDDDVHDLTGVRSLSEIIDRALESSRGSS